METNLPAPPRSRLGRTALRRASSSVSRQDWRVPFDDAVHLPDTWVRDEALRRGFGNVVLGDCHRATAEERAFRGRVAQARRRGQCLPGTERVDPLPPDPDDDLALGGADPHLDSPPSGFLRLLDHPASFGVVDDDESARWPSGSQREPLFLPSPTPDILASASPLRSTLTPLRSPTPSRSLSPLDLQMVPASEPDMPAWSPTHDATASVAAPSSLSSPSPDSASPCLVSRARSPLSSSRPSPSPSDSPTPSGLAHPPMEASPIYSSEPSSSPGAGQLPEYPQRPLVDSIRAQTLAYSPTPTRRWVTSPVCGASLGRASPVYGPASSSRCRPSSPWREWVPPTNGHDPTSSPPCEEVLRYPPSPPAGAGAEMTYASMSPPPSCGEFLQYPPSPPAETEAEMTYDLLPPPPVCRAAPHHLARLAVETDLEDAYTFLSFTGARHSQGPLSLTLGPAHDVLLEILKGLGGAGELTRRKLAPSSTTVAESLAEGYDADCVLRRFFRSLQARTRSVVAASTAQCPTSSSPVADGRHPISNSTSWSDTRCLARMEVCFPVGRTMATNLTPDSRPIAMADSLSRTRPSILRRQHV
ncbi:hypothetical protein EV122DRAFT_284722 [Schizophyllum commune]